MSPLAASRGPDAWASGAACPKKQHNLDQLYCITLHYTTYCITLHYTTYCIVRGGHRPQDELFLICSCPFFLPLVSPRNVLHSLRTS
jgi:hypothetical protein